MCKDYECCYEEDLEEEVTLDELIETIIEDINDGACPVCSLKALFELGYKEGRKDLAEMFFGISGDILDESLLDEE